jgi:hypothetical protein
LLNKPSAFRPTTLKTNLVLAAVVYEAHRGDAETLAESVVQAQLNLIEADSPANIRDAAADKGYHSADTLAQLNGSLGVRTYLPEPRRNTQPIIWIAAVSNGDHRSNAATCQGVGS